jgi:hypothetical protein
MAAICSVVNVKACGAKGDGVTDDTAAFQTAIGLAVAINGAVYVPAASVGYLITSPLNMANLQQLTFYGDGAYPCTARSTPVGGSVLIGATGANHCVIDASGASGVVFRGFTIASIGVTGASTIGVFLGKTTVQQGSNCIVEDVAILLPSGVGSIGIYGISANLITGRGLMIMSGWGIILAGAKADAPVSHDPPYGVWGTNVQSDGCYFSGCTLFGYGDEIPLSITNCTSHQYDQLYIVNINGGPSYTGVDYAMEMIGCTDIRMKVEIDYFPCALNMRGASVQVKLDGIIYQWTTPLPVGVPLLAFFGGTFIYDCEFKIRALAAASGYYLYGTVVTSPTLNQILGSLFWYNSGITSTTANFDFTSTAPIIMFNNRFDGDTDTTGSSYKIAGSTAATSTYRNWVNGVKEGIV